MAIVAASMQHVGIVTATMQVVAVVEVDYGLLGTEYVPEEEYVLDQTGEPILDQTGEPILSQDSP